MPITTTSAFTGIKICLALVMLFVTSIVSADVAEFQKASASSFAHPHDLCLGPDGKYLFVSDTQNDRVQVLEPESLVVVSTIGEDELDGPHDVTFDMNGNLLVADSGNDRIVVYKLQGAKARIIAEYSDGMSSPEGVTISSTGDVFVASTSNHKILHFKQGKLVNQVGGRGDGPLEFIRPHDIELGSDGYLYIGDPGNNRIQVLTQSLKHHQSLEVQDPSFNEPKYLALDKSNKLYVADQYNDQLRIFNQERRQVGLIRSDGSTPLNHIEGVEVVGDRLWISDTYNNRILYFRYNQN